MKNIFIQAGNRRIEIKESDDSNSRIILEGPDSEGQSQTLTYPTTDTGRTDAKTKLSEMIANSIQPEEKKGKDFIDQL